MKRDIFYRGTRMNHRYGPDAETPETFDPQFPRGVRTTSPYFCAETDGEVDYGDARRDNVVKPNGERAHRGLPDSDRGNSLMSSILPAKWKRK